MSRNCQCQICGRPTDCSGQYCELCLCDNPALEQTSNGSSCEVQFHLPERVFEIAPEIGQIGVDKPLDAMV